MYLWEGSLFLFEFFVDGSIDFLSDLSEFRRVAGLKISEFSLQLLELDSTTLHVGDESLHILFSFGQLVQIANALLLEVWGGVKNFIFFV